MRGLINASLVSPVGSVSSSVDEAHAIDKSETAADNETIRTMLMADLLGMPCPQHTRRHARNPDFTGVAVLRRKSESIHAASTREHGPYPNLAKVALARG